MAAQWEITLHLCLLFSLFPHSLAKSQPSISSTTCCSWRMAHFHFRHEEPHKNQTTLLALSVKERDDHAAVGTSSADLNPLSFDLNFFLPSDRPLRKLTEQHQSSRKRLPSTCIYCLPPNSYLKAQTLNQSFFNHQNAFIKQQVTFLPIYQPQEETSYLTDKCLQNRERPSREEKKKQQKTWEQTTDRQHRM